MRLKTCIVIMFFLFFLFTEETVKGFEIQENTKVSNIETGDKYIAYEHEDYNGFKSISLYNTIDSSFTKILNNHGEKINNDVFFPSISNDDRYLVYTSRATNVTDEIVNKCFDILSETYQYCSNIYLYDIVERKSYLIKDGNNYLNGDSYVAEISGNGREVVFESIATNKMIVDKNSKCLIDNINTCINIFKYSIVGKTLSLVSTGKNNYGGNANSISPSISEDGNYIVFQSSATNLHDSYNGEKCYNIDENDNVLCSHIYLVNTKENKIKIVTKNSNILFNDNSGNAILSEDGKYIVYESYATNIESKYNKNLHIIMYDVDRGENAIVSKSNNIFNNRNSYLRDISNDGKYIVYSSSSTNLNKTGEDSLYVYNINGGNVSMFDKGDSFADFYKDNICFYYGSTINCKKIDDVAPTIDKNQTMYVLKNSNVVFKDKINFYDNLTSKENIKVYISNNLIFNEVGEYFVDLVAVDEFENSSIEKIKIVVLDKDSEAPVFSEIGEIKVLKGSSTLNLSNYIEATDKIDGKSKIYIVDDGKLDLNKIGTYRIILMAKDSSENAAYKELDIVVYDNYNFTYYYEIILILGVIAVIIFSIIRVK